MTDQYEDLVQHSTLFFSSSHYLAPLNFADCSFHVVVMAANDSLRIHPMRSPFIFQEQKLASNSRARREVALQQPWPHPYNQPMSSSIEHHTWQRAV